MTPAKLKKFLKFVGIGLAVLFILIQLVPVSRQNPSVTREIQWNSPQTRELAQRACFDCHSNETVWPWYSYVAPVSWFIVHHVDEGRSKLDFSEWDRPNERSREILESITSGEMPLGSYLPLHPSAKLTETEKQTLLDGLDQTLTNDPPIPRKHRTQED